MRKLEPQNMQGVEGRGIYLYRVELMAFRVGDDPPRPDPTWDYRGLIIAQHAGEAVEGVTRRLERLGKATRRWILVEASLISSVDFASDEALSLMEDESASLLEEIDDD